MKSCVAYIEQSFADARHETPVPISQDRARIAFDRQTANDAARMSSTISARIARCCTIRVDDSAF